LGGSVFLFSTLYFEAELDGFCLLTFHEWKIHGFGRFRIWILLAAESIIDFLVKMFFIFEIRRDFLIPQISVFLFLLFSPGFLFKFL